MCNKSNREARLFPYITTFQAIYLYLKRKIAVSLSHKNNTKISPQQLDLIYFQFPYENIPKILSK